MKSVCFLAFFSILCYSIYGLSSYGAFFSQPVTNNSYSLSKEPFNILQAKLANVFCLEDNVECTKKEVIERTKLADNEKSQFIKDIEKATFALHTVSFRDKNKNKRRDSRENTTGSLYCSSTVMRLKDNHRSCGPFLVTAGHCLNKSHLGLTLLQDDLVIAKRYIRETRTNLDLNEIIKLQEECKDKRNGTCFVGKGLTYRKAGVKDRVIIPLSQNKDIPNQYALEIDINTVQDPTHLIDTCHNSHNRRLYLTASVLPKHFDNRRQTPPTSREPEKFYETYECGQYSHNYDITNGTLYYRCPSEDQQSGSLINYSCDGLSKKTALFVHTGYHAEDEKTLHFYKDFRANEPQKGFKFNPDLTKGNTAEPLDYNFLKAAMDKFCQ